MSELLAHQNLAKGSTGMTMLKKYHRSHPPGLTIETWTVAWTAGLQKTQ